jgi:hypothetical protein
MIIFSLKIILIKVVIIIQILLYFLIINNAVYRNTLIKRLEFTINVIIVMMVKTSFIFHLKISTS